MRIPENTLKEHSWKHKWYSLEVYWIIFLQYSQSAHSTQFCQSLSFRDLQVDK